MVYSSCQLLSNCCFFILNLAVMMLVSGSNDVHFKSPNTVWQCGSVAITILLEGQAHNILYIWPRYSLFLLFRIIKNNCYKLKYIYIERERRERRERERESVSRHIECEWSYFWMISQRCWHGGSWCSGPTLDLRWSKIFLPSELEVFNLSVKNFLNPFFRSWGGRCFSYW